VLEHDGVDEGLDDLSLVGVEAHGGLDLLAQAVVAAPFVLVEDEHICAHTQGQAILRTTSRVGWEDGSPPQTLVSRHASAGAPQRRRYLVTGARLAEFEVCRRSMTAYFGGGSAEPQRREPGQTPGVGARGEVN